MFQMWALILLVEYGGMFFNLLLIINKKIKNYE